MIELALLLPLLFLLLAGAVDFGRGYYVALEVSAAAEAGALYGTQNPTDTAGMVAAAKLDAKDIIGLTAVASYGCQCSDGTNASANCTATPACSTNVVRFVEVDTTFAYAPILGYPGIASSITLRGKSRLRASP